MKTTLVAALLSSVLAAKVSCDTFTIHDAAGFYKLAEDVNSGTSYAGTTVLLEADVDFTNKTEGYAPIGGVFGYDYRPFEGVFDGQGHTISNFVLNTTERYPSLFGMINGTGFRNLVTDSSCSITDWFEFIINSTSYSGGIVSYIFPTKNTPGKVEGCVNMGSITFFGNATNSVFETTLVSLGGIVGYVIPFKKPVDINNCVNYGSILYRGAVKMASLGGILGSYFNEVLISEVKCNVRNCANFGNLTQEGTVDNMLALGGISGVSIGGDTVNCITYGAIFNTKVTDPKAKIVGGVTQKVTISHCYWTNEVDSDSATGFNLSSPTVEESSLVEPNSATMGVLNAWVSGNGENDYAKWIMLHLEGGGVNGIYGDTAITLKKQVVAPAREGYKFVAWCADEDCVEEYNESSEAVTDIYASWEVGNYTIRFDLGNGTVIEAWYEYNSTIAYPDMEGVKGFYGWNVTFERMPGYDLVVGFKDKEAKSKGSNAGAIAGGVIGGVALLAIIVLIVLFIMFKKIGTTEGKYISLSSLPTGNRNRTRRARSGAYIKLNGMQRRAEENYISGERGCGSGDADGLGNPGSAAEIVTLNSLYTRSYRAPTLMNALLEAGLSQKKAELIIGTCASINEDVEEKNSFDRFTKDDAIAISMYTFDFGPKKDKYNPYVLISRALMGEGNLKEVRGILYILLSALRKLPRVTGRLLYRGVKYHIRNDIYTSGNVVTWPSFASTSPDMKAVKKFLEEDEGEGESGGGTLFIIDNGWGYNIQPYSLSPDEEEILLEPERRFKVESVIESEITIVKMTMLDTPLTLSQFIESNNDD